MDLDPDLQHCWRIMNVLVDEQVLHQGEGPEGSAEESAERDCGWRRGHAPGAIRLLRHQPERATGDKIVTVLELVFHFDADMDPTIEEGKAASNVLIKNFAIFFLCPASSFSCWNIFSKNRRNKDTSSSGILMWLSHKFRSLKVENSRSTKTLKFKMVKLFTFSHRGDWIRSSRNFQLGPGNDYLYLPFFLPLNYSMDPTFHDTDPARHLALMWTHIRLLLCGSDSLLKLLECVPTPTRPKKEGLPERRKTEKGRESPGLAFLAWAHTIFGWYVPVAVS